MKSKLSVLPSIEKSLHDWQQRSDALSKNAPIKTLKCLPQITGITKKTAPFLRLKSLFYLLYHDENKVFLRYFFKKPIHYGTRLIKSYLQKKSYHRDLDFFFYGMKNEDEFISLSKKKNSILVVGFSYCHKPFECPKGRFTDQCAPDPKHNVCGQCFIGKMAYHLPKEKIIPLFIPTIHYIGEKMFDVTEKNPTKEIFFLITACEMTLEMFGDWGNMIGAKGIGVRLDGRICNTMQAFILSEKGVKPGLTVVTDPTQKRLLSLLTLLHSDSDTTCEKV